MARSNDQLLQIIASALKGARHGTSGIAGRVIRKVDSNANLVAATGTLTSDGTAPSNNDTVTIGSKTYTFKTTLTGAANEVLIGNTADASEALANLKAAINASAGVGTTYGTGTTANADVSAGTLTSTTLALTAKVAGTGGNSLATTETSAHLSFGGATLSGGADNADTLTLTLDDQGTVVTKTLTLS